MVGGKGVDDDVHAWRHGQTSIVEIWSLLAAAASFFVVCFLCQSFPRMTVQ